jgi:hypothetical protein
MTTRTDESIGELGATAAAAVPEHSLAANTPGEPRAWDVDAALVRVAGANPQGFKERLRELALAYRAEEDQHLSFDEVQALATASARDTLSGKQAAHVQGCAFCRNLIDTLVGSNEERDAFLRLVGQHERRAEPLLDVPLQLPAMQGVQAATAARPSHAGLRWGRDFLVAAGLAAVAFGGFAFRGFVAPFGNGLLTAHVTKPGSLSSASVSGVDWNKATANCEAQSQNDASCNLFTAAAKLTSDGQAHLARPVFVSALQKAGVQDAVVEKIDATLAALPKSQGTKTPEGNSNPTADANGQVASEPTLTSAKIDFAAGRPVQGYEHVAAYVADVAERPDVARAVQAGFIAPVREAEQHRMTPETKSFATDGARLAQPAK